MIYQLLQVKELLPVVVVQRLQPHLLWTLDYAVRITGRLAKNTFQKVAILKVEEFHGYFVLEAFLWI